MKNISISNKNWRRLRKVRDEQGFKHFNKTLGWLMAQVFSPEKTTITLEPEIFDWLSEIKNDNGFGTFSQTIAALADELQECQEKNEQGHRSH